MPLTSDPNNWEKLSKKQKETILRSALIDQSLKDMKSEEKVKEEVKRTGLNITNPVLDCVKRVKTVWEREEARLSAIRQEKRIKANLTELDQLSKVE